MGAWGAIIMGFFGAVFAAMTLVWQLHLPLTALALPVLLFAGIVVAASRVLRLPGDALAPSPREERALRWSTAGEGIGIFIAVNVAMNLHRPDLVLPLIALVVGLHFLPIAAAGFRPFYALGTALIAAAAAGVVVAPPAGGAVAGAAAALILWGASALALRRDRAARNASAPAST